MVSYILFGVLSVLLVALVEAHNQATEADAKHQAKVLASMCGFDAAIKKITVQEC